MNNNSNIKPSDSVLGLCNISVVNGEYLTNDSDIGKDIHEKLNGLGLTIRPNGFYKVWYTENPTVRNLVWVEELDGYEESKLETEKNMLVRELSGMLKDLPLESLKRLKDYITCK